MSNTEVSTDDILALLPARYTLSQLTEIFGRHYGAALRDGGQNPERVLRLFTDRVVEDLKRGDKQPRG